MGRPRVLIADDHRMLREAFTQLLAPSCDVLGAVGDGRALLAAAAELHPDIVILDIAMPQLNGLDAARQLRQTMPEVKIIILTINEDPELAAEALRVGAFSYLLKNSAVTELQAAIEAAMAGRSYVTPLITRELVEALAHGNDPLPKKPAVNGRQREVLQLLAEGHTMKEIARILSITPRTVAFHKYGMMKQLGVRSTAELIQMAVRLRVVGA